MTTPIERSEEMKRLPSSLVPAKAVSMAAMIAMVCLVSTAVPRGSALGDAAPINSQREAGKAQDRTAPHAGIQCGEELVRSDGGSGKVRISVSTLKPYTRKSAARVPGSYANPVSKRRPSRRSSRGEAIWLFLLILFIFVFVAIIAACRRSKGNGGGCGEGWFFFGSLESDTNGVHDDADCGVDCGDDDWDFDIFDG